MADASDSPLKFASSTFMATFPPDETEDEKLKQRTEHLSSTEKPFSLPLPSSPPSPPLPLPNNNVKSFELKQETDQTSMTPLTKIKTTLHSPHRTPTTPSSSLFNTTSLVTSSEILQTPTPQLHTSPPLPFPHTPSPYNPSLLHTAYSPIPLKRSTAALRPAPPQTPLLHRSRHASLAFQPPSLRGLHALPSQPSGPSSAHPPLFSSPSPPEVSFVSTSSSSLFAKLASSANTMSSTAGSSSGIVLKRHSLKLTTLETPSTPCRPLYGLHPHHAAHEYRTSPSHRHSISGPSTSPAAAAAGNATRRASCAEKIRRFSSPVSLPTHRHPLPRRRNTKEALKLPPQDLSATAATLHENFPTTSREASPLNNGNAEGATEPASESSTCDSHPTLSSLHDIDEEEVPIAVVENAEEKEEDEEEENEQAEVEVQESFTDPASTLLLSSSHSSASNTSFLSSLVTDSSNASLLRLPPARRHLTASSMARRSSNTEQGHPTVVEEVGVLRNDKNGEQTKDRARLPSPKSDPGHWFLQPSSPTRYDDFHPIHALQHHRPPSPPPPAAHLAMLQKLRNATAHFLTLEYFETTFPELPSQDPGLHVDKKRTEPYFVDRDGVDEYYTTRFQELGQIGAGSYARVYKVRRVADQQVMAIKKLKTRYTSATDRKHKLGEVYTWLLCNTFKCAQLLRLELAWEQLGDVYMLTEWAPTNLQALLLARATQPLVETEVWALAHDVLHALHALHTHGWLHLDVKPANILVAASGRYLLADFGIARRADEKVEMDGDAVYLAPEALDTHFGTFTDIFALGLVLLETMANAELPIKGDLYDRLRAGQLHDFDPHIASFSTSLRSVVLACILPLHALRPAAATLLALLPAHAAPHEDAAAAAAAAVVPENATPGGPKKRTMPGAPTTGPESTLQKRVRRIV